MTSSSVFQPGADTGLIRAPAITISLALSLLAVLFFSGCLIYIYINWLSPLYSYLGFPLGDSGRPVLWFSTALVVFSASVLPRRLEKFSDFFLWMVFYFVYTPSLLFIPLQGLLPDDGFSLVCALAISFNAMRLMAHYRARVRAIRVYGITLTVVFVIAYLALTVYALSVYAGSLGLPSFADADVYEQRSAASDLATGSFVGYATGLLSGAFNPFLMALGLTQRRKGLFFVGVAGQVLMYSTSALKSVLLSTLLAPLFYFLLVRPPRITSGRLGLLIIASCVVPLSLIPVLAQEADGLALLVPSLIFMRTYGLAGALTGVYAHFFLDHPYTYFSHVNIVSSFVAYPYTQSLGEEVGYDLVGAPLDANANFWATDGIASAGNLGVILVGVLVGAFLILTNSVLTSRSRRLAFIAFIPFIMNVCNTSFFSSLLSGGGGLLLIMLYMWQSSRGGVSTRRHLEVRT